MVDSTELREGGVSRRGFFGLLIGMLPLALLPSWVGAVSDRVSRSQTVTIVVEGSVIGSSPEKFARELEALLEPDDAA